MYACWFQFFNTIYEARACVCAYVSVCTFLWLLYKYVWINRYLLTLVSLTEVIAIAYFAQTIMCTNKMLTKLSMLEKYFYYLVMYICMSVCICKWICMNQKNVHWCFKRRLVAVNVFCLAQFPRSTISRFKAQNNI